MLLCQNCGRDKKSYLLAVLDGFEGGTYCYFGFAISDIPADQSVHNLFGFHVFFGIFNGGHLVIRFRIRELFFKFCLPDGIRAELEAGFCLPFCV